MSHDERPQTDKATALERLLGRLDVEIPSELAAYVDWAVSAILPRQSDCAAAAARTKRAHERGLVFVYVAAAICVSLVAFQALVLPTQVWLIWGEVMLLLIMLVVQHRNRNAHRDWLTNRFLAERLRSAIFLLLPASPPTHDPNRPQAHSLVRPHGKADRADHWRTNWTDLIAQRRELTLEWRADHLPALKAFIAIGWLSPQREYHVKASHRAHRKLERFELLGVGLLSVTLIAALLHALGVGHHTHLAYLGEDSGVTVGSLWTLLALILPAVSASLSGVKHASELQKVAARSRRAAELLGEYETAVREARSLDDLQLTLSALDSFGVHEHEEWQALFEFKEPEVG